MSKEKKICSHCGASMMEHRHVISKELVQSLVALYNQHKPVNLKVLNLTRNAWNNFQKLRYWNLVIPHVVDGKRIGGAWAISSLGIAFVRAQFCVEGVVWTFRGKIQRREGKKKFIHDVDAKYRNRADYIKDMKPLTEDPPDGQMKLL